MTETRARGRRATTYTEEQEFHLARGGEARSVHGSRWIGSEVGETVIATYILEPVTEAWEARWLSDNRAAAQNAIELARTSQQKWMRIYGDTPLRQRMTPHAFRMALYFNLVTLEEKNEP